MPSSPLPHSPPAPAPLPLRFDQFEIRPATREIWRDGQLQPAARKVFDLLVLLVERRDRVVPKSEILQAVWGRAVVSEGVLARTVMKARKAIGDDGRAEPMLRTVHRIGYRFVAPAPAPVAAQPVVRELPVAAPRERVPRSAVPCLAVLPIEDRTGDADGPWAAQAVRTQAIESLRTVPLWRVLPEIDLTAELGAIAPAASRADRCSALLRRPGIGCALAATLRRQGTIFWLHYVAHDRSGGLSSGSLRGDEPRALGRRLAERWAKRPTDASQPGFDDPFAREAYDRGCELIDQNEWRAALPLLQVAAELQPDHLDARLQSLRAKVASGDPTSFVGGARLLADARARRDARVQAMTHQALAEAHRARDDAGADERAEHHMAEALRCAQHGPTQAWTMRLYGSLAELAIQRDDVPGATRYLGMAERAGELSGMADDGLLALRATLEIRSGQLLGAQRLLDEAHALARRRGALAVAACHLARTGVVHAQLGFLDLAAAQVREAASQLERLSDDSVIATVLDGASQVLWQTGAAAEIERALAATALGPEPTPLLQAVIAMARARMGACRGDLGSAGEAMQRAVAIATRRRLVALQREWMPEWLWLLFASGRRVEAEEVRRRIQTLAPDDADGTLQACALHAAALEQHAFGRRESALRSLLAAADTAPAGRTNALARLDAAWLMAELGQAAQAGRLLRDIGPWLAQHPLGLFTSARVWFGMGDVRAARSTAERFLARTGDAGRALGAHWARCYGEADESGVPDALPFAPRLPTTALLCAGATAATSHA